MKSKELLVKLGILATASVITTACLVGCQTPVYTNIKDDDVFIDVVPTQTLENSSISVADFGNEEIAEDETDLTYEGSALSVNKDVSSLSKVIVQRVVDGDTYVVNLDGNDVKVRLIGVDTPESVASQEYLDRTGKENTEEGKDISAYMKEMLPVGTILYLEFDVNMYDKYDRVLAYAYMEDGTMIQEHLLNKGFAKVMTIEPNVAHSERFVELEQKAMEEGVGLWADYENVFEDVER